MTTHTRARLRAPLSVGLIAGGSLALALAAPLAASAHITLDENTAAAGSYSLITFKVPNESATASTSTISVTLPSDTPLAYVSYVPVAGWTTELVTTTLPEPVTIGESELTQAVTQVVWTADPGSEIADGQLQLFPLSLGPIPDVGSLTLPVEQTYTDGTVVAWDEKGDDAEHPAPVLYVDDAPVADHHDGDDGHADAEGDEGADAGAASAAGSSSDVVARVLGGAGLVVGAGGLAFGLASRRVTRKPE